MTPPKKSEKSRGSPIVIPRVRGLSGFWTQLGDIAGTAPLRSTPLMHQALRASGCPMRNC